MNKMKLTGAALAIGAATVFLTAPTVASAADTCWVRCLTANGCRGFSDCSTANNACKGQNACKGKGYVVLKRNQCQKVLGESAVYFGPGEAPPF